MKTHRLPVLALRKLFLVMVLVMLALQGLGMNGLAAPAGSIHSLQGGTSVPMPLSCGSSNTPTHCNIQIVLMIDDSGSMKANDSGRLRSQGAKNMIDILADQYYSAAQSLHKEDPNFQLPDVRVAVIHFSEGVKKKSPWISIDPDNVDGWKSALFKEISWPVQDSKEYKDLYSTTQWTDFIEAFQDASQLLSLKDATDVQGDCTRRAILLFTDGTPENATFGILQGKPLDDQMKAINQTVSDLSASMPTDSKPAIYITGFQIAQRYEKPWNDIKAKYWIDIVKIVKPDATPADIEELIKKVETKDSLDKLPARMEEITASLINLKRFASNHVAGAEIPLGKISVPSFTKSIRFTLYNSDTAAKLEITDPNGIVITSPPDPQIPLEPSGAGTPIRVWQIDNPKAGDYKVKVQNATRPGILTWMYAYKGLSAQFENPPGSFKPGQPGDIKFRLSDSDGNIVLDQLKLTASVTQFGEPESPLAAPRQEEDQYTIAWNPKTSRPATLKLTLADGNKELVNCSLIFDLIGPTPTPTFTATSTSTATATATLTVTRTVTPIKPVPTLSSPPVIAIFPQCVSPGETVTLPMSLQYGGGKVNLASLDWQGQIITSPGNQSANVIVDSVDPERGEFQIVLGSVSNAAKSIRLQLKAQENANGTSVPIFDIASAIPVSIACNHDCTTGLWATWFWPLVIVLLGLLILLLVLRFRSSDTSADQRAGTDVYRTRDWHFLFWPLLVLFILLLLVRWMQWCITIPPWLFLVSILVWMIFVVLIRFFYGRDPSRPRPWWLLFLLLALAFLGYLTIAYAELSLLWLLLVLLLAWVILWYIDPDYPTDPIPNPDAPTDPIPDPGPVPPFDFSLVIGPATELLNRSVTVPVQVVFNRNESAESSLEWDVKTWSAVARAPGKDLPQNLVNNTEERGKGSLTISEVEDDVKTITVEARAEVGAGERWISTLEATASIQIMHIVQDIKIPVPIPVEKLVYEQVNLSVEFSTSCWPFGETVTLRGNVEYKKDNARELIHISPDSWKPSVRVLPAGPVVGARVESFDEESGDFVLIVDPVIITPETFDKEHPPARIQVQICADAVLGNGHSLEIIGKTATIALCKDDLTELEGIGPVYGTLLNKHNVFTFRQLAKTEVTDLTSWLNTDGYQREDPKTWPQQAELADMAGRYENQKGNYKAYKAWLDRGSEPDEREKEEDERRKEALPWNRIAEFTPVVLRKVFNASQTLEEPVTFPIQLNRGEDEIRLIDVEWKVNASVLPGENSKMDNIKASVGPVDPGKGTYELVIHPVPDSSAREIQIIVQALQNGRSIDVYNGKAITIDINPPALPPDNLEELEGIGPVYRGILNNSGIFTFSQLAGKTAQEVTKILNESGYEREDPKTWPQQAKLASIAKYGTEEDKRSYEAYKAWVHRGVEPDEVGVPEKARRKEALVWYGTAELTEQAYPEIFKQ